MKLLLLPYLVAGLLFTTGCDKLTDPEPQIVICYGPGPVKSVKDQEGIVRFNGEMKQYAIVVTRPGATGSDVGILHQTLPQEVQMHDLKVVFSGDYYEKPDTPIGGTVTEYYLQVNKIVAR